jgi:uncharacterized protein
MAEVKRKYHMNGELKAEWVEVNGMKEGIYKSYYPDRKLHIICNYVNGKLYGEYNYYSTNGKLQRFNNINSPFY